MEVMMTDSMQNEKSWNRNSKKPLRFAGAAKVLRAGG